MWPKMSHNIKLTSNDHNAAREHLFNIRVWRNIPKSDWGEGTKLGLNFHKEIPSKDNFHTSDSSSDRFWSLQTRPSHFGPAGAVLFKSANSVESNWIAYCFPRSSWMLFLRAWRSVFRFENQKSKLIAFLCKQLNLHGSRFLKRLESGVPVKLDSRRFSLIHLNVKYIAVMYFCLTVGPSLTTLFSMISGTLIDSPRY